MIERYRLVASICGVTPYTAERVIDSVCSIETWVTLDWYTRPIFDMWTALLLDCSLRVAMDYRARMTHADAIAIACGGIPEGWRGQ